MLVRACFSLLPHFAEDCTGWSILLQATFIDINSTCTPRLVECAFERFYVTHIQKRAKLGRPSRNFPVARSCSPQPGDFLGLQNLRGQTTNASHAFQKPQIKKVVPWVSGSSFIGRCQNLKIDIFKNAWPKTTRMRPHYVHYLPGKSRLFLASSKIHTSLDLPGGYCGG